MPSKEAANIKVDIHASVWARALTIEERARAPFAQTLTGDLETHAPSAAAEARFRLWCSRRFTDEGSFATRLALIGLTPISFKRLLDRPLSSLLGGTRREVPRWLMDLSLALALPESEWRSISEAHHEARVPFAPVLAPLLENALRTIVASAQRLLQSHGFVPFDVGSVAQLFSPQMIASTAEIATPTLVFELWAAKKRGDLVGTDSKARFEHFIDLMCSPTALKKLFEQYPVLARLLMEEINRSTGFLMEFLTRVSCDWTSIRDRFFEGANPGPIRRLDIVGDRHEQSRSVVLVTFGPGARLVYKPRPQSFARHFQRFLARLNERESELRMRTIKVLDRGEYGWCEFVERRQCESADDIARFYREQGLLLGILHLLGGSDIHQENVIAAGDQPILVDVEALFQSPLVDLMEDSAEAAARYELADSVMRTGLLPAFFRGIQLGGLTPRGDQYTDADEPVWVNLGTDKMCLSRQRKRLSASGNLPVLAGREVGLADFEEMFVKGFEEALRLLIKHRLALLAPEGPLDWFSEDRSRVLLRNTMFYARTLRESYHPDLMRDALDRDEVFDHLWRFTERRPTMKSVFLSECRALWNGDIPLFTIQVDSRTLNHGSKCSSEVSEVFFSESGMEGCVRRLRTLNDVAIERQLWFIRAAIASGGYAPLVEGRTNMPEFDRTQPVHPDDLVSLASTIADRLSDLACRRGGSSPAWVGLLPTRDERWLIQPIGPGLYSGTSGVALFLGYLGAISGTGRYAVLARETVNTLLQQTREVKSIGAFDGLGGVIYALSHLAHLWNDSRLLREVDTLVRRVALLLENNRLLDFGDGAAGCIAGLLSAFVHSRSSDAPKAAVTCGEQIKRYWPLQDAQALTGFAHGAAGISLALLELWHATGRSDFLDKAREIVQYERSLFSGKHGNWPDLRPGKQATATTEMEGYRYKTAWCHGATGIGLARVRSHMIGLDELTASEIATAAKTTIQNGFGGNHSLCHGDMGSLELLMVAQPILSDPSVAEEIERLMARTVESIRRRGCVCGVPGGVEVPGLMTGLAGVGYELLRLAAPKRVPSVLLMERPFGARS